MLVTNRLLAQSAEMGALPTPLRRDRARSRGRDSSSGTDGLAEQRGHPQPGRAPAARRATRTSPARLWEVSEELTGVSFLDEPE